MCYYRTANAGFVNCTRGHSLETKDNRLFSICLPSLGVKIHLSGSMFMHLSKIINSEQRAIGIKGDHVFSSMNAYHHIIY
jgi:hypothetical protein